jgi:hypothetical protein
MKRFKQKIVTIRDFLCDETIECNPIHQRHDVDSLKKKRGIIQTILDGLSLQIITLNDISSLSAKTGLAILFESIDGGHRKRSILEFFDNKFAAFDGRYFKDFSIEEKKQFLDYELTFEIYDNLSNRERGQVFRNINSATPTNDQEIRNSYGDTFIANLVRDYARDSVLKLKFLKEVKFKNCRYKHDELIARLVCQIHGKQAALSTAAHSRDLFALYDDESIKQKDVDDIISELESLDEFVSKVIKARCDKGLTYGLDKNELSMYCRSYFYYKETYGDFFIDDYHKFFIDIHEIYSEANQNVKDLDDELKTHHDELEVLDAKKGVAEQFISSLNEYQGESQLRYFIDYLQFRGFDFDEHVRKKRSHLDTFSAKQKSRAFARQDYKCGITYEEIDIDDTHADHMVSVKNGGTTTLDNCIVIREDLNRDKGSLNLDEYLELRKNREEGQQYVNMLKGKND